MRVPKFWRKRAHVANFCVVRARSRTSTKTNAPLGTRRRVPIRKTRSQLLPCPPPPRLPTTSALPYPPVHHHRPSCSCSVHHHRPSLSRARSTGAALLLLLRRNRESTPSPAQPPLVTSIGAALDNSPLLHPRVLRRRPHTPSCPCRRLAASKKPYASPVDGNSPPITLVSSDLNSVRGLVSFFHLILVVEDLDSRDMRERVMDEDIEIFFWYLCSWDWCALYPWGNWGRERKACMLIFFFDPEI
jgi:hypothetical protein